MCVYQSNYAKSSSSGSSNGEERQKHQTRFLAAEQTCEEVRQPRRRGRAANDYMFAGGETDWLTGWLRKTFSGSLVNKVRPRINIIMILSASAQDQGEMDVTWPDTLFICLHRWSWRVGSLTINFHFYRPITQLSHFPARSQRSVAQVKDMNNLYLIFV